MEKPARERTLTELGDSVVFWAKEMRKAEKQVLGAVEGISAAKRKHHYAKMKLGEAVDVLLARFP